MCTLIYIHIDLHAQLFIRTHLHIAMGQKPQTKHWLVTFGAHCIQISDSILMTFRTNMFHV